METIMEDAQRTTSSVVEFNPDIVRTLSDLRGRVVYRPEDIVPVPHDQLARIVYDKLDHTLGNLELELTARHPYADAGYADYYHPGRWDCESNLVFMSSIVQGPSTGEWDGTVGYAQFKAPTAGNYIVVVNFSGYQQTMNLYGPWGTSSVHSGPSPSYSGATTALWSSAAAGETLYANFSSRQDDGYAGTAFLHSFQVFAIA